MSRITIKLEEYDINIDTDIENVDVSVEVHKLLSIDAKRQKKREEMENYRHLSKWPYQEGETELQIYYSGTSPVEESAVKSAEVAELHAAMENLTEVERRRIKHYFLRDMTMIEVAEREKVNYNAVRKSIKTGIAKLRKHFSA